MLRGKKALVLAFALLGANAVFAFVAFPRSASANARLPYNGSCQSGTTGSPNYCGGPVANCYVDRDCQS